MATPRKRKSPTVYKFNKAVDSGPLPQDADPATQKMIQDERIRRQIRSRIGVPPRTK